MTNFETALRASSRDEVREALGNPRVELTLTEIARLTQRLRSFAEERIPLRLGIVRTYTTELLAPHWAFESLLQGLDLVIYEAPFGAVPAEGEDNSGLSNHRADLVLAFLRLEDLEPSLSGSISRIAVPDRARLIERAIDGLVALLSPLRGVVPGLIVATLLPRFAGSELGFFDVMAEESVGAFFGEIKARIAARLRESLSGVHLHDLDTLVEDVGRARLFDPRLWYSSRFPFSVAGAQSLVRRLLTYGILIKKPPVKCLVLDADNTLWGGIVGEDGIDGIALGPEYPGASFVAFQRRLLELQQRGILLALCSRNNEADVLEVLRSHPHTLLRERDFAARRVDWETKPTSLRALAEELNIGLDSIVFVDDSAHECDAVRKELPQVEVVRTPEDPSAIPTCLDGLPRLEVLFLTEEDRRRASLYASQAERRRLAATTRDPTSYLRSLGMVMTMHWNEARFVSRMAQLTQKTNQFNLTTRRYSESEMARLVADPNTVVAAFSLEDVFGDSGLVGVAIVLDVAETPRLDTFLMSCRVIGRKAEIAFLRQVVDRCVARGARRLAAEYCPTLKNVLVRYFLPQNGFREVADGRYELDLPLIPSEEVPIRVCGGELEKTQNPPRE